MATVYVNFEDNGSYNYCFNNKIYADVWCYSN